MPTAIKIPTVFTAVDKMTAVIDRMTSSVRKFSTQTGTSIQRFDQKISSSFSQLDVWSQRFIGLGAGLIAKSAFDDIRNFEQSLVGVGKTTGTEGKNLLSLGDKFIGLSKEMKSISTDKLLELGQVAGQLGISGSDDILKFSKTLAMLEKSSDIEGAEGATAVARIIGLTGDGISSVDKFASSLVALGNSTKATEGQILSVASEVGRATATYKLNSTTLLGISASLAELGAKPEAAGTAIAKVFRGIEMATIKGGKEMLNFSKVLQISDSEVKRLFSEDKQELFKKFIGGLNKISNDGGSVTATLEKLGLGGETVSKGIGPLATNFNLLSSKLQKATDEYSRNLALQEEFEAASNTINSALRSITVGFSNFITQATNSQGPLGATRDVLFFIGRNMDVIVPTVASLIGMFILLKAVSIGVSAVTWIYNTALGINIALQHKSLFALRGNAIALKAYAAAQWLVNFAMEANPIGLIILGITALIGLVALVVSKYDSWGASLTLLMGPFGMIINLIMAFRRNWDGIVNAFKSEGILGGIKMIGKVILDSMLYPLEQFLGLVSKIPGVGKMVAPAMKFIEGLRANLNLADESEPTQEESANNSPSGFLPSTQQHHFTKQEIITEKYGKGQLDVNLNDPGKMVSSIEKSGNLTIPVLSTTQGQR